MTQPFRLQSLLDYRRQREDKQARALAEAAAEEQRVRDAIAVLDRSREEQTAALTALLADGAFDAEGYMRRVAYLDSLAEALGQQAVALTALASRVHERREELVEALKDRRVLERLRDRQAEEAAVEDGRRETRAVDDMVMTRHQRAQ